MAVDPSLTVNRSLVYWRDDEGSREDSQRTQSQFELLVEDIDECAVFVLDENGHIRTWNAGAETLSGYTADEAVGEHLSTLSRESDVAAGAPDRFLQEAATKERVTDEGWRVRKDGSEFWADVTLTTLSEEDTHVGYAVTMCDRTRDRREQILLEQNRQLKSHIAALSHDLNNPLNVAEGNIQLALETGDLTHLETATEALSRVTELIDCFQLLAKEGNRTLESEPVDLREVTETAWRLVETDGADLQVERDGALVADRLRLQELLENLFTNAANHAGPDVTVSVGYLDDGVFYVEDDGPGIPEEERADVFEMNYSTDPNGAGFGLAICRQITTEHGWTIEVGDGSDGGARFEISGAEVA